MIPAHRCIRGLCDPDEGIHCLPNRWRKGKTLEDFRSVISLVEIIKVQEEVDVSEAHCAELDFENTKFQRNYPRHNPNDTGYLIWVREKEPA